MLESTEQSEANLEKVHRYYQRWEGCYNSPKGFSPLTDVSKIEQFARRIAQLVTYESELRKALATQHAIIILEKQIQAFGAVPITYEEGWSTPAESTTCETKSTPQPEVGRNSPCPCGSGKKYKRCCGVNAPPVLNKAA